MHEMSIAQSLIDIINDEMAKHGVKVLKSVKVHIGQLSAIVPEALSFCFNVMTSDTELEGAELKMEIVALKAICQECNETFEIRDYVFKCSACGSSRIDTIAGQDLAIVEMEAV